MRIARFVADSEVGYGLVEGLADDGMPGPETVILGIDGHPVGELKPSGVVHRFADVRLLAPILPSKVVAVGRNYAAHAAEMGGVVPAEPLIFLKPSTAIIGPNDSIVYPAATNEVSYEAELAVVIGRLCRDVPVERVNEVILGYTCANDLTARDLQRTDGQWTRAKGFDTFCPLGPWIETDLDPSDLAIGSKVDGEVRQDGRTSQMVNDVPRLVSWISEVMTLLPGDVILTGTPAGVGPILPGQTAEVTIEGIGTLRNPVVTRG
jgi:2-keto-4-pentenoate hydratase/2-oxohepta-3-ene-1,7-dioic acid hydratase in catechol pathway